MARSQTRTAYKSRFRSFRTFRMKLRLIVSTFAFLAGVVFFQSRRASVPDYIDHDPGIGFDLTSPYAYKNGTILNIAKIDASSAYNNMMSRLSLKSSKHLHPPYASLDDYFSDQPRQAASLPSSPEVYEIARLLVSLRSAAEAFLGGRKMSGAVATIPHLPALYAEDLEDAFEYVGIIYIPHYPFWFGDIFSETAAVYSGNGFGLCSNYTDFDSCDEERHHPPHQNHTENVLSVSYIRSSLTCTWAVQGMWFAFPAADEFKVVDYDLGWDKRDANPSTDYYWAAVRNAILLPILESDAYLPRTTHRVLVHGEKAIDEQFLNVLKETVADSLQAMPEVFMLDPVCSAARGAAEMAKRVYWKYNTTKSATDLDGDDL